MDNPSFEQDAAPQNPKPDDLVSELNDALSAFQTNPYLANALRLGVQLSQHQVALEAAHNRYIDLGKDPNASSEEVQIAYAVANNLSEYVGVDQAFIDYYLKKHQKQERIKSVVGKFRGLFRLK